MLLAAAGPGVFNGALVGTHQLLNAAADGASLKSALSSLTAAAFEASALVFVLLEACATRLYAAHRAADEVHGLVGPSLAWATLCAAVGTVLSRQLEPAQRRRDSSTLPLTSLASTSLSSASLESQGQDPPAPASAAMPPAHPPPRLLLVLLQPHNLGVMAFQSLYQLQSNFYLQTVQDSYESLLGVESAPAFVAAFHVAFPVSGFIATFPVTAILERTDSRPHVYWGAIAASILLLHLLWLLPSASAQSSPTPLLSPGASPPQQPSRTPSSQARSSPPRCSSGPCAASAGPPTSTSSRATPSTRRAPLPVRVFQPSKQQQPPPAPPSRQATSRGRSGITTSSSA